jgi:hypothetical protein
MGWPVDWLWKDRPASSHAVWSGRVLSVALGLLAFAAAAVTSATLGALAVGVLTTAVAVASLGVGLLVAWLAARACRGEDDAPEHGPGGPAARAFEAFAFLAFSLATLRQFLWLVVSHGGEVTLLNPYNYGDLPLHWTYVAYLVEGAPFWPPNPVLAGTRLNYPMGADLLAALFVKLGFSLGPLLRVTGVLAAGVLYVALRRWGGPLAVVAFVLSGGFDLSRLEPEALFRAHDPELPWKNVLLALFVPQRGFLYALPAGLALFWSARERLLRDRRGLPVWVEGLLWGALPLFHVHTFLVFSIAYGAWSLGRGRLRAALPSLAVAFPLGAFGVWQVTEGFAAARVVWWKPGWMIDGANPAWFLVLNFGLLLPLAVAMVFRPPKNGVTESRYVLGTALTLFTTLFFVMLAPWEWDNTKALVWAVLLMLGPLSPWLAERPRAVRVPLVALLLAPALPAAVGGFLASRPLVVFEEAEKAAVCAAIEAIPPTDRIATAQTFNHPVALCGGAIVAGYGGHLWSHGFEAGPVEGALRRLMRGEPSWEADAKSVGARYLFWGEREEREFGGSTRPWASEAARVWQSPRGALYRLPD